MTTTRPARVRAPELTGAGGWIGTDGPLTLRGLRGRFVLLDFWTSCCVNCLHVLDELRPLEQRFAEVLVVVGVHSPKFAHEADHAVLVDAVERYEVHHPVLDDPDLTTWSQYAVRAWPTLVLVDPEGYVVHTASGEGHGEGLGRLLDELVAEHDAKGTLRRGGPAYVAPPPPTTALRFPGKVAELPDGTLIVTDTAHHQLVVLERGRLPRAALRIGTGERGLVDGPAPRFAEPQGICVLADGTVLVADTANHVLRTRRPRDRQRDDGRRDGCGLAAGRAGGRPRARGGAVDAVGRVRARRTRRRRHGRHPPAVGVRPRCRHRRGPRRHHGRGAARRGRPPRVPRPAQRAGERTDRLWFVDAETSALRWYRDTPGGGEVGTAVGTGLFDFGHRDGPAADALLQHPLGVCVLPDGSVAVLDTYDDAVRRYDVATDEVTTLATGVREPSGAVVVDGALLVVASAAHRLDRVELGELRVSGPAQRTQRPVSGVAPGPLALQVVFEPPPGQHSTSATARRPDWSSAPRRRSCCSAAPVPRPGCRARSSWPSRARSAARRGQRGFVRRGRGAPGLPHHPAGLGHPGAAGAGAPARVGLRAHGARRLSCAAPGRVARPDVPTARPRGGRAAGTRV